ncbi:MAG: glucosyl-3-phosphoglycerate synthase, partial [Actinomycetota bacterium]
VRISVAIPALNEQETIAPICRIISNELMEEVPFVDELVVLDGESIDETALRADAAGARVVDVAKILPEIPVRPGKGESLWRSLAVLRGDIVVWIDADIRNFSSHFVTRLVAPLLCDASVDFVKGYYRRPIQLDGVLSPSGGGRVTELLARPMLDMLFPELAGVIQPLAGEYAGRAEVLRKLPFFTGYSVEAGLLIDLLDVVGLDGIAQVDLGTRIHRNRPLEELGPMAFAIARTIMQRAEELGRLKTRINPRDYPQLRRSLDSGLTLELPDEIERPPLNLAPQAQVPVRADLMQAVP